MPDPFTLRIFVPDGDPEGVRIIDRMNWTGLGIVFPRSKWADVRERAELARPGVYILVGYRPDDDDLPALYIGQSDGIGKRLEDHIQNKDFWDWGVVFVSTNNNGLNRAHVTWLEYALIHRANEAGRCHPENSNTPQEPSLGEADKADTQAFLKEILQILPLVGLRAFETPKPVAVVAPKAPGNPGKAVSHGVDTLIVAGNKTGFERHFLNKGDWHAVRISGGRLDKIKYIAGYQNAPVSAITHYAPVDRIEPYGENGKYRVVFSESAKPIGPITSGDGPKVMVRGTRYTTFEKLMAATKLADLMGKK